MKYYIIAGEASGDLHGSNLIKEIKNLDEDAQVRCWGGDLMKAAGGHLVAHYKDANYMGFAEVIRNLPAILNNLKFCKQDIKSYNPDVVILIDYPGFNLRIAEWAKSNNFKVVYYISPQVWAWKESRVKLIKKVVDKMIVILPFETDFYKQRDYKVEYVGHPLIEVVEEFKRKNTLNISYQKPVIALLPGSRKQEVEKKLPIMLQASRSFPDYQFVIAKSSSLEEKFYNKYTQEYPEVLSVTSLTYNLLSQSTAALVTSGTATLETALFDVPQVVCYKTSALSATIGRMLIKVKFISLVNLIMNKEIVKELIQEQLTVANVVKELNAVLKNERTIKQIKGGYYELKQMLQQQGNASEKAAAIVYNFLTTTSAKKSLQQV
jgi:lipid-A-disaccharide synthase